VDLSLLELAVALSQLLSGRVLITPMLLLSLLAIIRRTSITTKYNTDKQNCFVQFCQLMLYFMIADTKLFIGHSLKRDATKEPVIFFAQINSIEKIFTFQV